MLTATDLLSPTGEIEAALFPKDSAAALSDRLTGYLSDGYARAVSITDAAAKDAAARTWAYYRAFHAVFVRLSALPSAVMLNDQGSSSYLASQIATFGALADRYRGEFDVLVPATVDAASNAPRATQSSAATFTW